MSEWIEYIYTLSDPIDKSVRYVGRTSNVQNRYREHVSTRQAGNTEKEQWIRELIEAKLKPTMTIIEVVHYSIPINPDEPTPGYRERYWIGHYLSQGAALFNKPYRLEFTTLPILVREAMYENPVEAENVRLRAENTRLRTIIEQITQILS